MHENSQIRKREISYLDKESKEIQEKINELIEGKLDNEVLGQINNLRVKIYNNDRKIQNIKEGLPQNGYGEISNSYSISDNHTTED